MKNGEVAELTLALGLLVRRMRSAAPPGLQDLSWTQKSVLLRLEKDGLATTAELARAEGVKPQSMGTAVTALEDLGLVKRTAHPTDGRQAHIGLTPEGATLRKRTKDAKQTWLAQAIAKLSKPEQAALFAAGEIIQRLVDL